MNFKAIATLANAADEIARSVSNRSSPRYLTEKLAKAIELEVGLADAREAYEAQLSGEQMVYRDGKAHIVVLKALSDDERDAFNARSMGMTLDEYGAMQDELRDRKARGR